MASLVLPSYYLAPVSYYSMLHRSGEAVVSVHEHYQKQTLRNRCLIDSPNGPLPLTIPVVKAPGKCPMHDIRISDHGNWRHQHWQALCTSYRQSPFFEYYADDFAPFYERKWDFLVDFNEALQRLVCSLIDVEARTARSQTYLQLTPSGGSSLALRPYYQVFAAKHGFQADLSIVDLLFNMGPESILCL